MSQPEIQFGELLEKNRILVETIRKKAQELINNPLLVTEEVFVAEMPFVVSGASFPKSATNEDAFIICVDRVRQCIIVAVADGMGGEEGGEVASGLIKKHVPLALEQQPQKVLAIDDIFQVLNNAINNAKQELHSLIKQDPILEKADTTFTALIIVPQSTTFLDPNKRGYEAWLAHIGDSRLYELGESLTQLTTDDSLVNALKMAGFLNSMEAKTNRNKNVVTNALFNNPHTPRAESHHLPLQVKYLQKIAKGTSYVLVTDGISDQFADIKTQNEFEPLVKICSEPTDLIAAAQIRKGQDLEGLSKDDDQTVVIVQYL